jgi:peptidyl-prolyl cis-trans isomerase C
MQVQARHILVKTPEQIADIQQRLAAGEEFSALATQFSECPSKANGGNLGEFGPGQMVKPFEELAFALPVGAIGGPVQTQFGLHMIQRTA